MIKMKVFAIAISWFLLTVIISGCYTKVFRTNLVSGTITIQPGSYYDASFTVDAKKNVRLQGWLQAEGSPISDIEILVLDEMAFTSWVNGHQVAPIYYSGKIVFTNIDVAITTSGDYHVVISNMFSVISSKNVTAEIEIVHWRK